MTESDRPADDQVEAIVSGAQRLLAKAQERAHILSAVLRGIDQFDAVMTAMRSSDSADAAGRRVMGLLDIDEVQARAVMDIQVRSLSQRNRQRLRDEYDELLARIAEFESVVASPNASAS